MTYRGGGGGGDHRTPMAWHHRDLNMSQHEHGRHRETSTPSRHGGYPSPTRHSVERERGTPASRRARGHSRSQSRDRMSGAGGRGFSRSGTSPSSTDGTTEDTTETESQTVDRDGSEYHGDRHMGMGPGPGYPMMLGYPMMAPPQLAQVGPLLMPGTGSIRSVQSVPMLSHHTWDGEPCPVHHNHGPMVPLAALYGMPGYAPSMSLAYSVPPSVISGATTVRRARSVAELSQPGGPPHHPHHPHHHYPGPEHMDLDRRSIHASMASLGHSQVGHRGHRMVMAENGAPSKLPMREPKKASPVPSKDEKKRGLGCCSGHFVVMWIILGIVTFGVLLGIVLKFTVSS